MKFAEYILNKSESRAYSWIVFILTICESIFLFIPPEVFMTPPIIANKKRAAKLLCALSQELFALTQRPKVRRCFSIASIAHLS